MNISFLETFQNIRINIGTSLRPFNLKVYKWNFKRYMYLDSPHSIQLLRGRT